MRKVGTVPSWVESANDPATDFPIQNLPFGVFRRMGTTEAPRGGVAIGDQIFDLAALGMRTGPNLNKLAAAGRPAWKQLRKVLTLALSDPKRAKRFAKYLVPMKKAELFLPVQVGDYSDFYTGIYHAHAIGKMFRPDAPLLVATGDGYGAQGDAPVHFGLAGADRVTVEATFMTREGRRTQRVEGIHPAEWAGRAFVVREN